MPEENQERSLISHLYELHDQIANGELSPIKAASELVIRTRGGLTQRGAADLLARNPMEVEAEYRDIFNSAEARLAAAEAEIAVDTWNSGKGFGVDL